MDNAFTARCECATMLVSTIQSTLHSQVQKVLRG